MRYLMLLLSLAGCSAQPTLDEMRQREPIHSFRVKTGPLEVARCLAYTAENFNEPIDMRFTAQWRERQPGVYEVLVYGVPGGRVGILGEASTQTDGALVRMWQWRPYSFLYPELASVIAKPCRGP